MELIFLGTGAGMPTKRRNVTAIALELLQERGGFWLFDCGEGTQHQILHTAVKPGKIEKLFVTHLHGDHIYGLPGFLTSRSYAGGDSGLTVYGPKGVRAFIETSLQVSSAHLSYPLEIVELEEEGMVFEDARFRVSMRRLEHRVECFGYRVEEKDGPGTLDAEKLRAAGVEPGPIYREIREGRTVVLPDGRSLDPADYMGPARKGRIVVILGDTRYCGGAVELAQGADLVVHEATFAEAQRELAGNYGHSTSMDAARVATEAGAGRLVMTHFSSRYQEDGLERLLEEARHVFPDAYVASDFDKYPIVANGKSRA